MSKENTAVFIGHNECYGVTSEQIKEAIVSLIDKGVTEFLSGGQGGFDRHPADAVSGFSAEGGNRVGEDRHGTNCRCDQRTQKADYQK